MTPLSDHLSRCIQVARSQGIDTPGMARLDRRTASAIEAGQDIAAAEFVSALQQMMSEVPGDFALRCGRGERLADQGMIGYAIASSGTLEQALGIWLAKAGDFEPLMRFQSAVRGDQWRMTFQAIAQVPPPVRRFLAEEWLSSFFAFLEEVTGITDPVASIELRHASDPSVSYRQWLPTYPTFRATINRLTLPATLLKSPLRSRNDEMLGLILAYFNRRPAEIRSYAERLRRALLMHLHQRPGLGQCADILGVSPRTLVRRLSEEGTSFSEVLDAFRRDQAMLLVRDGRLGAKDIARAVGFAEAQSLRRAFVKWTGVPLGRWRNRVAGKAFCTGR